MRGPSEGLSTPMADGNGERPPVARGGLHPPPRSRPGHRARRPALVPWLSGKADNDACGTTNPRGDFNVL